MSKSDPVANRFNRRDAFALAVGGSAAIAALADAQTAVAAPLKSLARDAQRILIRKVETFDVLVPQPPRPRVQEFLMGTPGRINVTMVETDSGVRGYSFLGSTLDQVKAAKPVLEGQDLFAIEHHLKRGLIAWGAIEEAIWDAIGRIAGQPVSKLLGGEALETVPAYVTFVWAGGASQDQVTPKEQAKQAVLMRQAGFRAMKIRIFRRDYNLDVEACGEILAAGGSGFRVMVDRTATQPRLWTYEQGLAAARALEKVGCYWLEEPFARDDYVGPARLSQEVKMLITGGEGYRGLEPYRECLKHGTYEILQPEVRAISGIWMTRKVGVLAQAWGLGMAPHGTSGLALAGRVQCSAAMGSVYQEIAVLTPPMLPDDVCAPFLPLIHGEQPFKFRNGDFIVPQHPGLGLNIDEAALRRYRVEGIEIRRPPPGAMPQPVKAS